MFYIFALILYKFWFVIIWTIKINESELFTFNIYI